MNWFSVKLIFLRELRDQLRDRRTLFTVVVLPLVLYPLMGVALLQVAQFMREYPTRVWIVGSQNLPSKPAFIVEDQIDPRWTDDKSDLIELHSSAPEDGELQSLIERFKSVTQQESGQGGALVDQLIQHEMERRQVDLAVFVPEVLDNDPHADPASLPNIFVFQNTASDKSNMAGKRFAMALKVWQKSLVNQILMDNNLSASVVRPFKISRADVAQKQDRQAAMWSKVLPLIIMVWCLTGAFYPAVDLCAGEKERGTFETLLSSPARRSEIAIGKLLTVITFSAVTAILNLVSMGFTGLFVFSRIGSMAMQSEGVFSLGPPPVAAMGWLLLALVPISALFSAMALAAAAFARSSKEGQYYLIPLMMISMPLMMLPMLPAARLDLGTSLIPVTGLMMMLRCLIEGQYAEAIRFGGPVVAVTLVCCWISVRWVVHQFNSESVLFRASERFGVSVWLKQVMRSRKGMPTAACALLCAIVILVVKFFVSLGMQAPGSWNQFSKQTVIVLLATVGVPAVLMALIMTRDPRRSLRLRACRLPVAAAAVLAAILLHPLFMALTTLVMTMYPPTGDLVLMEQVVSAVMADAPGLWAILLVFAVAPALIEEVAFRGFILSGFQSIRSNWGAVILSAVAFGLAHAVIQQSIITFVVGMVLAWIAIRTRSLIPCILYHATHNGITVILSTLDESVVSGSSVLSSVLTSPNGEQFTYAFFPTLLMGFAGLTLLAWIFQYGFVTRPRHGNRDAVVALFRHILGRRQTV